MPCRRRRLRPGWRRLPHRKTWPRRSSAAWACRQGVGPTLGAEQAERIGALLRAMTAGTLELLTARMVAKRELGAAATQVRTRENNPLKFSPDVDAALSHLLGPAERGFLDPEAAVEEAFDDLRAHQVALLAGMRAALDSVMSRFDPAALEKRLAPGGALENLIPANRRARLWSNYSARVRAHRRRDRRRLRRVARPRLSQGLSGPAAGAGCRSPPARSQRLKHQPPPVQGEP